MKGPTEEEIRNVIIPLMLSGAKMLDRHCPKCGSPLFEKDGRIFCPVCEYREKKGKDQRGVDAILTEKLNKLAAGLPDDVGELEKHLRVMGMIIELIERYRKLEGAK
ncbi:Sjogren's syndrome/scleroderma autoantigen 1 family protein [Thermococcus sp.]